MPIFSAEIFMGVPLSQDLRQSHQQRSARAVPSLGSGRDNNPLVQLQNILWPESGKQLRIMGCHGSHAVKPGSSQGKKGEE